MQNPLISCIIYEFEMLIVYIFFSRVAEKRLSSSKCISIGFLLFGVGSFVNLFFQNNVWINAVSSFIMNFLFFYTCFNARLLQSVCFSFILDTINFALELASIFAFSAFFRVETEVFVFNFPFVIVGAFTSKSLLLLTCLALSSIVKPKKPSSKIPAKLFYYPISSTICLLIFWYICSLDASTAEIRFLLAISSVIIFGSAVLLFITYQHQIEEHSKYIRIKSEYDRLQTEKSYYDILEQQNQNLMIYVHDTKNHLAALQTLSDDPTIQSYVAKLSNQLKNYSKNCHSGNMMLDVIINKYVLDCENRKIPFSYNVRSCNLKGIEDIDLVSILGNLMDNALTAAENAKDTFVSLETTMRNGYNVIIISNRCDIPPNTRRGYLITSKEDTTLHGFGLKSVSKTLKKYQGDFSWEYDANSCTFITTAMVGQISA